MENDISEKVGRIYRMKIQYCQSIAFDQNFYERIIKTLRLEEEYVIYTTLAVSRNDIIFDLTPPHNGYKFHQTFKPLQSAVEIPIKELPLFLSWPITTPDFFRVLKGEI